MLGRQRCRYIVDILLAESLKPDLTRRHAFVLSSPTGALLMCSSRGFLSGTLQLPFHVVCAALPRTAVGRPERVLGNDDVLHSEGKRIKCYDFRQRGKTFY